MNNQWDAERFQRMAMNFAQKFGREQERWARRAAAGFGAAVRGGKMLGDGDLRLIVLLLLEEAPRHGYDIIKALEERSNGIYSPSPGVVYPTLTYLDEAGYATAATEGNKRVYSITDAGRAYLNQNREQADDVLQQMAWVGEKVAKARAWAERSAEAWSGRRERERPSENPSLTALDKARRRLRALIADAIEAGDDAEQRRLADILNRAAVEFLGKGGSAAA